MLNLVESLNDSYPAVAETVPRAREAVTRFAAGAGASPEQLEAVRLAVSEALTNAVVHAYRGSAGSINVTAALAEGDLWVLVADDGRGLRAGGGKSGLGIGLALIARVSDYFAIVKRSSGGTEVRMRFRLETARSRYERGSEASASRPA